MSDSMGAALGRAVAAATRVARMGRESFILKVVGLLLSLVLVLKNVVCEDDAPGKRVSVVLLICHHSRLRLRCVLFSYMWHKLGVPSATDAWTLC
jgi:hypothetical protein